MSETLPSLDDIRRVYSRHSTKYGYTCEHKIGIGWVEELDDEIPYIVPAPPENPEEIINWGEKHNGYLTSGQLWKREETPKCWSKQEVMRLAKVYGDIRWYEIKDSSGVPKHATLEMLEFASKHWKRRLNGVHILINGELVYLTGLHWYYLQWCWIGDRYPDYRDNDRYFFYAWDSVCKNPRLAGMTYLKKRRDGATFKSLAYIQEFATRVPSTNSYITSNTLVHAKKSIYLEKLVPMYDKAPPFFKPFAQGYDKPQNGFIFDTPPRKMSAVIDQKEGLKSNIMLTKSADGSKLHAVLFDESAKKEDSDVYEDVKIITPTMVDEGKFLGKMLMPTTMEEVRTEVGVGNYRRLWNDSAPSLLKKSGTKTTPTKLVRLFFPAWYGLYDDMSFVGRFGEAIIDKPTKEQYEWLTSIYKEEEDAWGSEEAKKDIWLHHGSWSYLKMRRSEMVSDNRALASELRKYPFTVEEAFRPSAGSAVIDPLIVGNALADLHKIMPDGKMRHEHLAVRGNLVGEIGNCEFVPDKNGMFEVSQRMLDFYNSRRAGELGYYLNDVYDSPTGMRPANDMMVIGLDPIDMDKKHLRSTKLSDMCAIAFWKYDIRIDGETYDNGGAREMLTHSFVMRYRQRNMYKRADFENVLKMASWLGCQIHFEINRGASFRDFLNENGCIWFKAASPAEAHKPRKSRMAKLPMDTYTDEYLHQKGTEKIQLWVYEFGSALTCPFVSTWMEWSKADLNDLEPFDEYVATEYALLKGAPGVVSVAEKNSQLAPVTNITRKRGGSVYEAFY